MAGVGTAVTVEELRQRLVLLVRLHLGAQAEPYADEVLDRLALKLQHGEALAAETLTPQALVLTRSLIWEAKLRLARGESAELGAPSIADAAARASGRAALSVALANAGESQGPAASHRGTANAG